MALKLADNMLVTDSNLGISEEEYQQGLATFAPKKVIYTRQEKIKAFRTQYQKGILTLLKQGANDAVSNDIKSCISGFFNQVSNPCHRAIAIGVLAAFDLVCSGLKDHQQPIKHIFSKMDKLLKNLIEYGPDSNTANQDQQLLISILLLLKQYPSIKSRHKELLLTIFQLQPKSTPVELDSQGAFVKQATLLLQQANQAFKTWAVEHNDMPALEQLYRAFSRLEEGKDVGALTISTLSASMLTLISHLQQRNIPANKNIDDIIEKSLEVLELLLPLFLQGKEQVEIFDTTILLQRIDGVSQRAWESINENEPSLNYFIPEARIHQRTIKTYLQQLGVNDELIPSPLLKLAMESQCHLVEALAFPDFIETIEIAELLIQHSINISKPLKPKAIKLLLQWDDICAQAILQLSDNGHYDEGLFDDIGDKLQNYLLERSIDYKKADRRRYRRKLAPIKLLITDTIQSIPNYIDILDQWRLGEPNIKKVYNLRYELLLFQEVAKSSDIHSIHELATGLLAFGESLNIHAVLEEEKAQVLKQGYEELLTMFDAVVAEQIIHNPSNDIISQLFKHTAEDDDDTDNRVLEDASESQSLYSTDTPEESDDSSSDNWDNSYLTIDRLDDEIKTNFFREAKQQIETLNNIISDWYARPHLVSIADQVMRILHNIKSNADLAGFQRLTSLVHDLEHYVLDQITLHSIDIGFFTNFRAQFEIISDEVEYCQSKQNDSSSTKTKDTLDTETSMSSMDEMPFSSVSPDRDDVIDQTLNPEISPELNQSSEPLDAPSMDSPTNSQALTSSIDEKVIEPDGVYPPTDHVKVSVDQLNHFIESVGKSIISRGQLAQQLSLLDDAANEFDSTKTRIQSLIQTIQQWDNHPDVPQELSVVFRQFNESVHDLDILNFMLEQRIKSSKNVLKENTSQLSDLNIELVRSRTISFNSIVDKLTLLVERTSVLHSKQVKLQILNADTDIDRHLLFAIATPLEHLLRNAIIHGIEDRETRLRLGKPLEAKIIISVENTGASITVKVLDDGAGLDLSAIYQQALAHQHIDQQQASKMDDSAMNELVFIKGLTTVDETEVTADAGHGLGLYSTKADIHEVGGKVRVETKTNQGTQFYIELPPSFSPVRALVVMAGNQKFVLPLSYIQSIERASKQQLESIYENSYGTLLLGSHRYQYRYLGELLNISHRPPLELVESQDQSLLLCQILDERYALHVNAIDGVQDMVISPLPKYFDAVSAFIGVAMLNDGHTSLVLNTQALITDYLAIEHAQSIGSHDSKMPTQYYNTEQSILFVDDSLSVRKKISNALRQHGYYVRVSKDGVDALRLIHEQMPIILVIDTDMPKMGGFELLAILNKHSRFDDMIKIVCSDDTNDIVSNKCKQYKVDHLLPKPYNESDILETIAALL